MVNISRTQVNPKEHNFKTAHQYTPEIELLKKETHTHTQIVSSVRHTQIRDGFHVRTQGLKRMFLRCGKNCQPRTLSKCPSGNKHNQDNLPEDLP